VICFLTDGEFAGHISRQLKTLRQDRTMIHTFAFGETYGEETLKALAANNRGEYRFVP
jgi:ABC-type Fe3+ transport system substrate-binding protein